jgi:hypothetical protein
MALMKKSDLQYDDYSWTALDSDNPKITGKPDSTMFSRHEGYEVLSLINRLAKKHGLEKIESGQKLETMIHNYLPSDVRSQANVQVWLENNWENY